jgi:hypothetical protein
LIEGQLKSDQIIKGTVVVGASKYGPRLSRKKPIFISDPPKTTTMINQPTSEEEEDKDNTSNNNGDDMKLEPRSAAFVSNQPSRLSQQQEQERQREQQQQQQQQASVYPYSVKIEQDTKGNAKISVHTYHSDINTVSDDAVKGIFGHKKETTG